MLVGNQVVVNVLGWPEAIEIFSIGCRVVGSPGRPTLFGHGSWCCDKKWGRECWLAGFWGGWAPLSPNPNLYSLRHFAMNVHISFTIAGGISSFGTWLSFLSQLSKHSPWICHLMHIFFVVLPSHLGLQSTYADLKFLFHDLFCFILKDLCWYLFLMITNFSCSFFLSDFCFFLLSSFARSLPKRLLIAALELILWKEGRRGMVKVPFRTNSMTLEKSMILSFTLALKIWACLHLLSQRWKRLSMAKRKRAANHSLRAIISLNCFLWRPIYKSNLLISNAAMLSESKKISTAPTKYCNCTPNKV